MSNIAKTPSHAEVLPGRLYIAVETGVEPPVDSRKQELPIDKISWQNFEKLCYRLALSEADVETCRIYGEAGNKQHGIDFYARRANREKWTVYQCKRVKSFGPAQIKKAVNEFIQGELVAISESFVICTSESMRTPSRIAAVENMRDELKKLGVNLELWDSEELNIKLKTQPFLVADFFHVAWARSFCPFVPLNLVQRLSASEVREFRENCRGFYEQVFAQADAGWINSGPTGRPIPPLAQRFIGRDVLESRSLSLHQMSAPAQDDFLSDKVTENRPTSREQKPSSRLILSQCPTEVRTALPDWLAKGGQFVLAGEPGAGKSTILRFLALDLLSASPTLAKVAVVWGDHLPVWVPFPLWTRLIAERGATPVSLIELLREWFNIYSNGHFLPLFERALADDRLLLLVDGLDEWRDESAAKIALHLLNVFIGQRKTQAIFVGRPQGLSTLGPFPPDYSEAALAPLNRIQQRSLVERLLDAGETSTIQADAFFRDLEQLPALRTTAGIPLLLGLLLRQHLEHARLPLSRFLASERMVDTLLRDHPIRRQQVALLRATPLLDERELRSILSYVAWRTHIDRPEGIIEQQIVLDWLQEILADEDFGLAYPKKEARRISNELLRHGEREFGILVERAPGWFGFFHRTIQELLAAEFLGTQPRTEQLCVLRDRTPKPAWHEVLLAWCHRRSTPDFEDIVTTLEEIGETTNVTTKHHVAEFLTELATGGFRLPVKLAQRLVRNAVETVWTCEWPRHRRRLLDLVLDGLHGSHAVRSIVQDAVRAWYPARLGASYSLAKITSKWESSPALIQALLRTLHHEEESAQRSAAEALGFFAIHDLELVDRLAQIAETSIRATTRACALEALSRGQPEDPRLLILTERERHSGSGEIAIIAIKICISKKLQTAIDLKRLLRCAEKNEFRVSYYWQDDLLDAFLRGWPNSSIVKIAAIKSLACDYPCRGNLMEHEIAFPILIQGFSGYEEAATAIANFFHRNNFIKHGLESHFLDWLSGNARWFSKHPKVTKAVESYLFREVVKVDYSYAQVALLAKTDRVKNHLIEEMRKSKGSCFWYFWALIHGWGVTDSSVMTAIQEKIVVRPESVAELAEFALQVFPNRTEARDRLIRCFQAENILLPWLLLLGLIAVDGHLKSPDVIEACFHLKTGAPAWEQDQICSLLIEHAAPNPSVRTLALDQLNAHDGALTSVAEGFGHDEEIRSRLIQMLAPMPTDLRAVIVDRLEALPTGDTFAHEMLSRFDSDQHGEIKSRAAVAYSKRECENGSLTPSFISHLRSLLHVVGHDYEERRQAAVAALLELGEFEAIRSAFSGRFSDGRWLFGESYRENKESLLRQLARHWFELKSMLGEEAFVEFTYQDYPLSFATRLATYIEGNDAAYDWLQNIFAAAGRNGITFALLANLAHTEPGSERLLALCLGVLHGNLKTPLYGRSDQTQTAELVANHWAGNSEVLSKLTDGFSPTHLPELVIIALSLGWPDCQPLAKFYESFLQDKRMLPIHVSHALWAVFLTPEKFAKRMAQIAIRRGGNDSYFFQEITNYYSARLRRDDETKCAFMEVLKKATSPDVRVTLAGMLTRAAPDWTEFQNWRDREISKAETMAEFGHNLSTSKVENLYALLTG